MQLSPLERMAQFRRLFDAISPDGSFEHQYAHSARHGGRRVRAGLLRTTYLLKDFRRGYVNFSLNSIGKPYTFPLGSLVVWYIRSHRP
jgi:hypothetical protein